MIVSGIYYQAEVGMSSESWRIESNYGTQYIKGGEVVPVKGESLRISLHGTTKTFHTGLPPPKLVLRAKIIWAFEIIFYGYFIRKLLDK